LDALCEAMLKRMKYAPGEVDMVLMRHHFIAEYPTEKKREHLRSRFLLCSLSHSHFHSFY
jgi:hypothetical protein